MPMQSVPVSAPVCDHRCEHAFRTLPESREAPDQDHHQQIRYLEAQDKLIISIDVGNSFSSVTLAHLTWNTAPLSRSSRSPVIRTVMKYPHATSGTGNAASRTPTLLYYDRENQLRALGAECLTPETKSRAREDGWQLVKQFKEQMRPDPNLVSSPTPEKKKKGKKVIRKSKTLSQLEPGDNSSSAAASSSSANSLPSSTPGSSFNLSSLREEVTSFEDDHRSQTSSDSNKGSRGKQNGKSGSLHEGPRLKDIWADFLTYLVACARAYFAENVPEGSQTFDRLWDSTVFVFPHPADWTSNETDLIRDAMISANLIERDGVADKLVFVRDSVASATFTNHHTDESWLQNGQSLIVCDASAVGVSLTGYTLRTLPAPLQLVNSEPITRLEAGAESVVETFKQFITCRLAKTRFKSIPIVTTTLVDEFRAKVLPSFAGTHQEVCVHAIRLRIVPEGKERDHKGVLTTDASARIRDGWMTFSAQEIESVYRHSIELILAKLGPIVARGKPAKSIVLTGGFGESPYLLNRLRMEFESPKLSVVFSDVPAHTAVSEGALLFYLSRRLQQRKTRYRLGFETAVELKDLTGVESGRPVIDGAGGKRLIKGKFSALVEPVRITHREDLLGDKGSIPSDREPFTKAFHVRYRLHTGQPPIFSTLLWAQDPNAINTRDNWLRDIRGEPKQGYRAVCQFTADLKTLVDASVVHGQGQDAHVVLDFELVVATGKASMEACVTWKEQGETKKGEPSIIADEFF
ncbi:Hsp70 family protein [Sporobolomyces koalae]|uniref:Hsp70 family protein n=1 Tax=Sporobolomyces koalae TaxID=500713 RepID=UPI00316DDC1D